jgi:hypothetical protein
MIPFTSVLDSAHAILEFDPELIALDSVVVRKDWTLGWVLITPGVANMMLRHDPRQDVAAGSAIAECYVHSYLTQTLASDVVLRTAEIYFDSMLQDPCAHVLVQDASTMHVDVLDQCGAPTLRFVMNGGQLVQLLSIVPNPTTYSIETRIKLALGEPAVLTITDAIGRIRSSRQIVGQGVSVLDLSVGDLPSGQYWLRIRSPHGEAHGAFVKID